MSKHQNEIDLIEQYLEGSLDEEKKRIIEEKISMDENYAENFEQYKLLIDGVNYSGRKKLYTKIEEWDMELSGDYEVESEQSSQKPFKWYYAAASIVIFFVTGFLIYFNLNSGYDRIVADYYKTYVYLSDDKRGDNIEKNSIKHIFEYYERGEYIQFIQMINKLEDGQKTDEVIFYIANAYQAIENYDEAIPLYEQVIIKSNSVYGNGSKWYLALCYLSMDKVEQARPLLEELKGLKTSYYSAKAINLLEDLN